MDIRSALFSHLFDFRNTEFYINYLKLIQASSRFCTETFCQFMLLWLPKKVFTVPIKTKRQINPIPIQIGGTDMPDKPSPLWAFENWVKTISFYSGTDEFHRQAAECIALIVVADLLSVVLQHYNPYDFPKDLFQELMSICFSVFYHTEERSNALPAWAELGSVIFDSYAYVIRRFSMTNLEGVLECIKQRIPVDKSSNVTKEDIRFGLKGIRFLDINLLHQSRTEVTRDLFEYYVQLCEHYKKSIKIRNALIELFITSIRQLDFEIQYEARLFETYVTSIYNHAEKWMKQKELKTSCLRLMSTIIAHFLLPFNERNAEPVLKQLLKNKKEELPETLEAIGTLLQDKFKINKNLDLRGIVGPGATNLERDTLFADIVYAETDKNTLMFDEDVLTGQPHQEKGREAEFSMALQSFAKRSLKYVNIVQEEYFKGKKAPVINLADNSLDDIITLYCRVILRMAQFSLETVLQKTIPSLIVKDWSKSPEVFALGFSAIKLLCSAGNDNENDYPPYFKTELASIKRNPNYTKLIQDFQISHIARIQQILHNICEPVVGIDVVGKSPIALPVTSYRSKATVLHYDSMDNLVEDEDSEDSDEKMDDTSDYDLNETFHSPNPDLSTISGFSMHRALSRSVSTIYHQKSVFEQTSVGRTRSASEFSKVMRRRYSSFTNVTGEKIAKAASKQNKQAQKKISLAAKIKKDKALYIYVMVQIMRCLPYIVTENVLASSDERKFIAVNLAYNDFKISTACSHSLQKLVVEKESLRHSLLRGMTELIFNRDDFRDDIPTVNTMLDNICIMLELWKKENEEATHNLSEQQINEKRKITIELLRGWVDKLEAVCISVMCLHSINVRKSALKVLEAISHYIKSEEVKFKQTNIRTTCFDILKHNEHDIIQQSVLRVSLEDVHDVELDVDYNLLLQEHPNILSIAQRDDSHILWAHVVAMIGQTLTDVGYMDCVNNILKNLQSRSKPLAHNLISESAENNESLAFLYSTSLALLFASTGVPDPTKAPAMAFQSIMSESLSIFKHFNVWSNLHVPWMKLSLFHASSCINYQFILPMYKSILELLHQQQKNIKKHTEKGISLIHDIAKAMAKFSNCSQFQNTFSVAAIDPLDATRYQNLIMRQLNDLLEEIDTSKLKSISSLYEVLMIKHYLCVSVRNFAWALRLATQKDTVPKVLDAPYSKPASLGWSEDDRTFWILFLQKNSGRGSQYSNETLLIAFNKELDKFKSQDQREEWKEKFDIIIKDTLPRLTCDAAVHLVSLQSLKTIFNDNMDYPAFKRNIDWFVEADKNHSGGHSFTMGKILYHHFEHISKHFFQTVYSENSDEVLEVYVTAFHEIFLNPPHDLAPRIATIASRVQDWVKTEYLRQLPSTKEAPEDSVFANNVSQFAVELLHMLLFLLNHRSVRIHSQAFEILYALACVNFAKPIDELSEEQLQNRTQQLKELARLEPSYRTRSTTALQEHSFTCSLILSKVVSHFDNDLFKESFKRFKLITVPQRKTWLIRTLIPWSKNIDLQNETNTHFVSSLFELSVDATSALGFRQDMGELWKEIALMGNLHTPDTDEPYSANLKPILDYLMTASGTSRLRDDACRNICTAMYSILPKATSDILVTVLKEGIDDVRIEDMRTASIGFFSDILGESERMMPVYKHFPIILPYILVYMDHDAHGNLIEPNPHQNALLSILMKLTSLIPEDNNHWKYLQLFLKSPQTVSINWSNTTHSKVQSFVTENLKGTDFYDPAIELLPLTDYHMSVKQLIIAVFQCVETVLGNDVINHIGHYCLEAATMTRSEATITYKYLTVYKHILADPHTTAITPQNIHKILTAISQASDHNITATGTPTTLHLGRSNYEATTPQNNTPEYVGLVCLSLSLLKTIAERLHERGVLIYHSNIFWMAVTMLGSTSTEIYSHAVDILTVFKDNQVTCDKFFRGTSGTTLLTECKEYTQSWTPSFPGIQPLLLRGMQIPSCEERVLELLMIFLEYQQDQENDDTHAGYIEVPTDRRHLTSALLILPRLYREAHGNNLTGFKQLCARYQAALNKTSPNLRLTRVFNSQFSHPDEFISNCCAELAYMFLPNHLDYCADVLYSIATESEIEMNKAAALKISSYILLVNWNQLDHIALTRFASTIKSSILQSGAENVPATSDQYRLNIRELVTISFEISRQRQDVLDVRRVDVERINESSLSAIVGTSHYQFKPLRQRQLYARTTACENQSKTYTPAEELTQVKIEVSETRSVVNPKPTPKTREEIQTIPTSFGMNDSVLTPPAIVTTDETPQIQTQTIEIEEEVTLPMGGTLLALGLVDTSNIQLLSTTSYSSDTMPSVTPRTPRQPQVEQELSEEIIKQKAPSFTQILNNSTYYKIYQAFMRRNFSDESLSFYHEVEDYSEITAVTDRALIATDLIDTYLKTSGNKCIPVSEECRSTILREYTKNVLRPSTSLFRKAVDEVMKKHEEEYYQSFLSSNECKSIVRSLL
jgi:hypothetical protein